MPDELLVLGSSSGVPTQRRFPSAYALMVTGKLFLIDCGAPVSTLLYRYDLDPVEVQAIFLSHWHMDHVANLGMLLAQNHQYQRANALRVYGPRGTRGKVGRLLADSFLSPEDFSYRLDLTNVKLDKTYKEALLRVRYFKTQHLDKPKLQARFGHKALACGMVITGPGWRIVYSGDLRSPQELTRYVKDCDLLIHEMAHHTPQAVADFAAEMNVPRVLLSHIGLVYEDSPEKIRSAFAKRYDGELIIAEDGTKVRLSLLGKNRKIGALSSNSTGDAYAPDDAPAAGSFRQRQIDSASANFIEVIQREYDLTSPLAYEILRTAQDILIGHNSALVKPGQMLVEIPGHQDSSEEAPVKTDMVAVSLTFDTGDEDNDVIEREGVVGLRRGRILRITEEASEQGGVLTPQDLSTIFNVTVRTILRDIQALRAEGHYVPTRGHVTGSLSHQSYKIRVVELWLDRNEIDQIARWLHHSDKAVERCTKWFLQAAKLHREEMPEEEIADLIQLPIWLASAYITLYKAAASKPHQRAKLKKELSRFEAR